MNTENIKIEINGEDGKKGAVTFERDSDALELAGFLIGVVYQRLRANEELEQTEDSIGTDVDGNNQGDSQDNE